MRRIPARTARALLWCVLAALVAGCSLLADEFAVLDRAAPQLAPAPAPSALQPAR